LGTYKGHNGVVWALDVSYYSEWLLTASGDNSTKMWDVETGQELFTWKHQTPVRSVAFALGDQNFLSVTDSVMGLLPSIFVYRTPTPEDRFSRELDFTVPKLEIKQTGKPYGKIHQALFGPLNSTIFTANEDGTVRIFDTETGKQLQAANVHTKGVNGLQFASHMGYFITASDDGTAKLVDTKSLEVIKTYEAGKAVNAAALSPLMPHVVLGGGQDAAEVTTTHTRTGAFQTRFFHTITAEEMGNVKGHFGPIHTLSFSPDGRSFASGSEDGYVRIHHFDQTYFESAKSIEKQLAQPVKRKDA